MKKVMSLFLIFSGIILFLYPSLSELYVDYQQKKMISKWEETDIVEVEAAAKAFSKDDATESVEELNEVFSANGEEQVVEASEIEQTDTGIGGNAGINDQASSSIKRTNAEQDGVLGVIEIDKINLRLPILYGASARNLDLASGLLTGTSLPGTAGNSAIAAHRSRTYGRMFNRLDEIGAGDIITVKDKKGTYKYQVYDTLVVKPQDVSVLNSSQDEKELTLITCTPIDTATHRLIVKAKIVPQ